MSARADIVAALADLRDLVDGAASAEVSGRERALVLTKLDEADLWLTRVRMRDEAGPTW